ncbi:MAG: hypothetical protein M4579_004709 [Chaenotheca gracillima]|nr:MAG: hypothetical protein M4579_004709 [Chaenotheca gracillima]
MSSSSEDLHAGVRLDRKSVSPVSPVSSAASPKKRKADETSEPAQKKRKRRKGKKEQGSGEGTLDLEAGVDTAFAKMDSRFLADFMAQRTKRYEGDLSIVELEDKQIPEKAYKDTSTWQNPRTLEHLPDYLDRFSKSKAKAAHLSKAPTAKGSPHTLVVTNAGLRAADLTRYAET